MNDYLKIVVGIIFLVGLFYLSYYLRKKTKSGSFLEKRSKYLKSIDRLAISNNKWLELIQVQDEILLIGIAENEVTLLKEYDLKKFDFGEDEKSDPKFNSIFENYIEKLRNKTDKRGNRDEKL